MISATPPIHLFRQSLWAPRILGRTEGASTIRCRSTGRHPPCCCLSQSKSTYRIHRRGLSFMRNKRPTHSYSSSSISTSRPSPLPHPRFPSPCCHALVFENVNARSQNPPQKERKGNERRKKEIDIRGEQRTLPWQQETPPQQIRFPCLVGRCSCLPCHTHGRRRGSLAPPLP